MDVMNEQKFEQDYLRTMDDISVGENDEDGGNICVVGTEGGTQNPAVVESEFENVHHLPEVSQQQQFVTTNFLPYKFVYVCPQGELSFLRRNRKVSERLALYAELDDKNRVIATLKQRLRNQQLQLAHYLHQNLSTENVLEFSTRCLPHLIEDNMQLSLAMCKFVRDTGGKSRLMRLHEKLQEYGAKVNDILERQESLLKIAEDEITSDGSSDIKGSSDMVLATDSSHDDLRFADRAFRIAHIDLYSRIMNATVQVRNQLEHLRLYSERIIELETERNDLVDHVFSLPSDQRLSRMNLVGLENQHEVHRHDLLRPEINCVKDATDRGQQCEPEPVEQETMPCISYENLTEMLHNMESEAVSLLAITEEQKNNYAEELIRIRKENNLLVEKLHAAEEAASDERLIQLQYKCDFIEREVDEMRRGLEVDLSLKDSQIARMSRSLEQTINQTVAMEETLMEVRSQLETVQTERDILQEELAKAAEAGRIMDPDVQGLQEMAASQEEQIKHLLMILSQLGEQAEIEEAEVAHQLSDQNKQTWLTVSDTDTDKAPPIAETHANNLDHAKDDDKTHHDERGDGLIAEDSGMCSACSKSASESDDEEKQPTPRKKSASVVAAAVSDVTASVSDVAASFFRDHAVDSVTSEMPHSEPDVQSKGVNPSVCRSRISRSAKRVVKTVPPISTTSLHVESLDKDGRMESMKAVLETSLPLDGLLEMDNSSKLRLRLQCTSPSRYSNNSPTLEPFFVGRDTDSSPSAVSVSIHKSSYEQNLTNNHQQGDRSQLAHRLELVRSEMDHSLSTPIGRKTIIHNIKNIYSHLFGATSEPQAAVAKDSAGTVAMEASSSPQST